MKKVSIVFSLLLLSTFQTLAQDFRFGTIAGFNLNSPNNLESKIGYRLGAKGELGISDLSQGWYMDMAILLETHSWKDTYYSALAKYKYMKVSTVPWYLNFPVHVGYRYPVSQGIKLFVNAGPYISVGLFGKMTYKTLTTDDQTIKGTSYDNVFTAKDTDGENVHKRLDWGVGLRMGLEIKNNYQIILGYDRGFNSFYLGSLRSRANIFSASVAYMF